MTDHRFRFILIAHVVSVLAAVLSSFVPGGYSVELSAAYDAEPYWLADVSLWILVPIVLLIVSALIAGIVGLYLFKPWGRSLSFWLTVIGTPVAIFAGPTLSSGLESTLWELSAVLWGAVLALAYYSPVANRFGVNDSSDPNPLRGTA